MIISRVCIICMFEEDTNMKFAKWSN